MREECKAVKILAVNVNTTRSMTRSIAEAARVVARPGTEIVELTPSFGADSVEGNVESYMAAVGVMDAVVTHVGDFDAVIQAGFGEHGKEGLMELLDVPVVDITEAAAHLAMLVGRRYSVVTTLDRTVPGIEDRLACFGLSAHCASVRSSGLGVLELEDADAARRARSGPRPSGCGPSTPSAGGAERPAPPRPVSTILKTTASGGCQRRAREV